MISRTHVNTPTHTVPYPAKCIVLSHTRWWYIKSLSAIAMWHPRRTNTPTHTVPYTECENAFVVSREQWQYKTQAAERGMTSVPGECMIGCRSHVKTRTHCVILTQCIYGVTCNFDAYLFAFALASSKSRMVAGIALKSVL